MSGISDEEFAKAANAEQSKSSKAAISDDEFATAAALDSGAAPSTAGDIRVEATPVKSPQRGAYDLGLIARNAGKAITDFSKQAGDELMTAVTHPGEAIQAGATHLAKGVQEGSEGVFRGTEGAISALTGMKPIPEPKAPQKTLAEEGVGTQKMQAMEKQFPLGAQAMQAAGEMIPQAPFWELGQQGAEMASAKMFSLLKPETQAFIEAAKGVPGLGRDILNMTTHGGAGVFIAGLNQSMDKQTRGGKQRGDIVQAVQDATKETIDALPMLAGGGLALKTLEKVGLSLFKHHHDVTMKKQNMALDAEKAAAKRATDAYDLKKQRYINHADAEQQHADMIQKLQEQRQAQIDEMQSAQEVQKKRLQHLEKMRIDNEKNAQQQQKDRLSFLKQKREGNDVGAKTPELNVKAHLMTPAQAQAVDEEIDKINAKMQARAMEMNNARQAHDGQTRSELEQLDAEKRARVLAASINPPDEMARPQPKPLSFTRAQDRMDDAQTIHSLEKGRGNETRAKTELDDSGVPVKPEPEGSNLDEMQSHPDEAINLLREEFGDQAEGVVNSIKRQYPELFLYGTGAEGGGIMGAINLFKKIPAAERSYEGLMHIVGVQSTADIFRQYAPELEEKFWTTSGRVARTQMGVERIDPKVLQRGLKMRGDVNGQLAKDFPELSVEQRKAIVDANQHVQDYLQAVKPVQEWLDTEAKDASIHSGLGRLRRTLSAQVDELQGRAAAAEGGGDSVLGKATGSVMQMMFKGRKALGVMHMLEKGVTLHAKEGPVRFARAIGDSVADTPTREFNRQMWSQVEGPITEMSNDIGAFEGWNKVMNAIGKPLREYTEKNPFSLTTKGVQSFTGQFDEKAANNVASALGLQKAARDLGYEDGNALAKDILDARKGQGALASDSAKLDKAMATVTRYVNDVTGTNVPGFRNTDFWQRNQKLKALNLFMKMPTVQARNMHVMMRDLFESKTAGQAVARSATVGVYLGSLYLAAGEKGWIGKDMEPLLRDTMGVPNWYKYMDGLHAARMATHLPSIPHLQQSIIPLLASGGSNAMELMRGGSQGLQHGGMSGLAKGVMIAAANQLGGAVGVGVVGGYGKAVEEGNKGYQMMHVFQHEALGGEKKEADIPIAAGVTEALAEKFWGVESTERQHLTYLAQKAMDIRQWVMKNDPEAYKEGLEDEKYLGYHEDETEANRSHRETLSDLRAMGYADDSPEIQKLKDDHNLELTKNGLQLDKWTSRAKLWEMTADGVAKKRGQQQPEKPQA